MVGVRAIAETDVKILDRIAASVREHGRQMQRSTVTARSHSTHLHVAGGALCRPQSRAPGNGGVNDPPAFRPVSPRSRFGGSLTPPLSQAQTMRISAQMFAPFARATRRKCRADGHALSLTICGQISSLLLSHFEYRTVPDIVKALRCASIRCAGLGALTTSARGSKVALT